MRSHRRFNPAMLKILERQRTEKRARERSHQFTRGPERWLKSALGPCARQSKSAQDDVPFSGDLFFRLPSNPEAIPEPRCMVPLSPPAAGIGRAAKHYAALHAEAKELAAKSKAKTRRKRATAIDAKRLKLTVERVRKPIVAKPQVSAGELPHNEPTDHWLGRTRHPGLELGPDGGQ